MLLLMALPFVLGALSAFHTGHFAPPELAWTRISPAGWLGIATLSRVFFSHGQALELAFTSFNAVYWTLAIEVQFYLVMYVALLLGRRADAFLLAVTAVGCALAFVPAAYNTGFFLPYWPLFAVGLALFRWVEAGMVPAALGRHHTSIAWLMIAGLATALMLLIASGALKNANTAYPLATFFLFGLGFAVFLWFALEVEPWLARNYASGSAVSRMSIWLIQIIGASSYSIYLLHGKLYALPAMFARQVATNRGMANLALTMGLTIALACLFSVAIERRFVRRRPVQAG
jgi:peptidoglycan/LPS O-acetylase OafA/YrhL